jgi:flagellar motor protein MotB
MAKNRPPEPEGELPAWLMTYSDVITLMMTFFILLMTFSTTEPENFERLQVAMFSGGDASGFVGEGKISEDSLVVRERPRSARKAQRGTEMPPSHADATTGTLKKGLASLETDPRDPTSSRSVTLRLPMLVDSGGEVSGFGEQMLKMFARQLARFPLELTFNVSRDEDAGRAVALAMHLTEKQGILPGRVAVGVDRSSPPGTVRVSMRKAVAVQP